MGLRSGLGLLCVASCVWALRAEEGLPERRAPAMGFMGMRGKKDYDEKRAPASMGFSAMRGKKDPFLDLSDIYPDYKRAPQMGFMGMRGKKDLEPEYELIDFPYEKRVPATMGFAAMKGKKAPSGFMGMRGKKFDYPEEDFIDDDVWPLDEFDKRAPSGFYGTRGKKMPQNSAFYGMRGKKGPSGFVGMRGKKGPASGFMGVRGKKDGTDDLESLLALLNERQGERSKRDGPTQEAEAPGSGAVEAGAVEQPGVNQ